ncbi:Ovate protein family, C-terminal [Dillenia turbinata]|uniref:Transcription repressor n=1 Tax=Dillenia turbinata TaxID=194707 RepID=A0AAN8V4L9_9MAGN
MFSKHKRGFLKRTVPAGCGCGSSKLFNLFKSREKTSTSILHRVNTFENTSSSWERNGGFSTGDEDNSSTTFSLNIDMNSHNSNAEADQKCRKIVSQSPKISGCLSIVKESNDPYIDFRNSMLQMILENNIYSGDDLQELLTCFLRLNCADHHKTIIRVFMEIWNGASSAARPSSQKLHAHQNLQASSSSTSLTGNPKLRLDCVLEVLTEKQQGCKDKPRKKQKGA